VEEIILEDGEASAEDEIDKLLDVLEGIEFKGADDRRG